GLAQWSLWRAGVARPSSNKCSSYSSGHPQKPAFFDDWMSGCSKKVEQSKGAYGAARMKLGAGVWYQLALAAGGPGKLDPLPMAVKPGESVLFRVTLDPGYTTPTLYIEDPVVGVKKSFMKRIGESYAAQVVMPQTAGRYYFEILASDPSDDNGPKSRTASTVAWAPLFVGIPIDEAPDAGLITPSPSEAAPTAEAVLNILNAERAKFSLPPMIPDSTLTSIATEHVNAWIRDKKVTAPDAELDTALESAGIQVESTDWTTAGFEDLTDSLALRLRRPSRKERLLWPGVVRFGVGLAEIPASKTDYYYQSSYKSYRRFEIAVKETPAFDLASERNAIINTFNELREAEGDPAFTTSAEANDAAQQVAESVCRGEVSPQNKKALDAALKLTTEASARRTQTFWGSAIEATDLKRFLSVSKKSRIYSNLAVGICRATIDKRKNQRFSYVVVFDP
ncbi:MAG: hypothetical protein U0165_11680, partial [Polyangiaceae bacterium]